MDVLDVVAPAEPMAPLAGAISALESDVTRPEHWRDFVAALAEAGLVEAGATALRQATSLGLSRATAGALEVLLRFRAELGPPRDGAPEDAPAGSAPPRATTPPALLRDTERLFALFRAGRHDRVASLARNVIRRWPRHVAGHEFLAAALDALGRHEEAIAPARRVIMLNPGDTAARLRLDRLVALRRGEAPDAFGSATLPPAAAPAASLWQRGAALQREGRIHEAIAAYREAEALQPDIPELLHALAAALQSAGALEECGATLARAVALKPGSLHLRQAEAGVLLQRMRFHDAAAAYRAALALDPDNVESLLGLANALKITGPLAEAEAAARRAATLDPDCVSALSTLGHTVQLQGRTAEALGLFRAALARDPEEAEAASGLLFCVTHDDAEPEEVFAAHRDYGARVERRVEPMRHDPRLRRHPDAPRLGFVSGDLRAHAVAHFVAPFLFELAARGFDLHAYSTVPSSDQVTAHLKRAFAGWTEAVTIPDADLALRIEADRVDILFDLSGHTAHHRLPLFARRPAPVQVSWIGYPGTTGLARMDYFLCNPVLAPHGLLEPHFTERLVRLPFSTVFDPFRMEPAVAPLPALANGHITFGSFNRLAKVTPAVIALWARVLHAVPESRMMIAGLANDAARDRMLAAFASHGVPPARLIPQPRTSLDRYLTLHDGCDLLLDSFPYSGGTGTCFAAWMGVPTLTLAGRTMQARVGASLNAHLGLHDFVADSADDYLARAVAFAANPPALATLRAELRGRVAARFTDPARVVDGLEVALHGMWRRWCHGLPPAPFDVTLDAGSILDR